MQVSDYNKYMDTQQAINLALLQGIRDMDVQFAFPTRSIEFIGGRLPEINVAGVPQEKPAANQNADDADTQMLGARPSRSEEHTSELQSLMRISYAVFCLKKKSNSNQ